MRQLVCRRSRLLGLLCALAGPSFLAAQDWAPNLTATTTWHDNATNAKPAADRISALQVSADVIATNRYSVGRYDSLHPTLHAAAEWWPKYHGLLRGAAGARLGWRHKFGLGPLAPVFSLEGGVDAVAARESIRDGTSTHLLVGVRKRINDVMQFGVWQEFTDHNARAAVFDRKGAETALELDRDLTEFARLTVRLSYRDGDILSHATPPRPDLVALAPNRMSIDTFGRPLTAYSIDARTFGVRVSLVRAIDTNSALVGSYEARRTERDPLKYMNQLVSLAIVHQF